MTELVRSAGWCDARASPGFATLIETLVRLESPEPTTRPRSIAAARELAARLVSVGARVTPHPRRPARRSPARRVRRRPARRSCSSGTSTRSGTSARSNGCPCARRTGRLYGPGIFDMKAGLAVAMLAMRALSDAADAVRAARRHALDDRRGDRQRHVAGDHRGRGSAQRRGAGARAVAARRRGEDQPQGLRRIRADRARRRGARRPRSRQGRQRDPRAGAPDPRARAAAGPRRAASPSTSA